MRNFEEVRALFQKISEQEQQFAIGSGGGAAGSRVSFRLSQPINGSNSVVATCLTDCPPGANRTALVRADNDEWYAFTQSPTTQGPESISQNRRSSPPIEGVRIAAVISVQSSVNNRKLYLTGHGSEAVFLCDIPRLLPVCPRETGPIGSAEESKSFDAYYVGGDGAGSVNWSYEPRWYCSAFRNGLGRLDTSNGTCGSMLILIPPAIGYPPVSIFNEYPFPLLPIPAGVQLVDSPSGHDFFFDENNMETHPRCEYPNPDAYNFAVDNGVNMNLPVGRVGAFSFNHWADSSKTVYFAIKRVTVRVGEDPPRSLSFTATTTFEGEDGFGAIDGVFSASMGLIGHERDNVCLLSPVDGGETVVPGTRLNDFFSFLSGDASYWYVSVYDSPICRRANSSELSDLYERIRYFRIRGSTVESSSAPYPEDWRSRDVMPNKALKFKDGNLWRGKFVEVDQSAIEKQEWHESSEADRSQNMWYTPKRVKLTTKVPSPVNGTLPVEDFRDANGNVVLNSSGNPVKVETKGVVQATARLTALSPSDYEHGQLPMFQIAIAAVF